MLFFLHLLNFITFQFILHLLMKCLKPILLSFFLLTPFCFGQVFAQNEQDIQDNNQAAIKNNLLFVDFGVLVNALMHNGWGLGVTGEHLFGKYFSIQGKFNHSVIFSKKGDNLCTTENIEINFYTYPFGKGLDRYLYLGGGALTEFLQFNGDEYTDDNKSKSAISLQGRAGWKQPLNSFFSIEAYTGYKWLLHTIDVPDGYDDILHEGFLFGLFFNLNFGNIFRYLKN